MVVSSGRLVSVVVVAVVIVVVLIVEVAVALKVVASGGLPRAPHVF